VIEAVLVVFTRAHPGRDDDLNDWYTNIHLRDALRFRGSIAAQRFRCSASQIQDFPHGFGWTYLALYEVYDAARFSREHWENAFTTRMQITDAIDDSELNDFHYYPLAYRCADPATPHPSGVVIEQFNPAPGQDRALRAWYESAYLPALAATEGVHSSALLIYRSHGQIMPHAPKHVFVGIHRLNDPAALTAWHGPPRLADSALVGRPSLAITHWDALTPRITEDDVHHTTAAALAAEERARAHMGTRILTQGRDKIGPAPQG
jgi:hypothetical protein